MNKERKYVKEIEIVCAECAKSLRKIILDDRRVKGVFIIIETYAKPINLCKECAMEIR